MMQNSYVLFSFVSSRVDWVLARIGVIHLLVSVVLGSLSVPVFAQSREPGTAVPQLTATQIVSTMEAKNKDRAAHLKTYVSTRAYELEYQGFPSRKKATMAVDVKFNAPQAKQLTIVSEEGSGILREHVLHKLVESERESAASDKKATALTLDNYDFALVGTDVQRGYACYVLEVSPKKQNKFLYKGRVWIGAKDFAVVHIEAQPAKNPSFWISHVKIEHDYEKFGEFWLPVRNQSVSSTRFGGRATLKIDYGKYQIRGDEQQVSALPSMP